MKRLFITADSDYFTKVGELTQEFNPIEAYIEDQDYGSSIDEICVVFLCQDFDFEFKPRIRFVKKELCLYMDIVLDYQQMVKADEMTQKKIMGSRLLSDTSKIIAKYKFKDFDLPRFEKDLKEQLELHGFL